jgi:hypothetical protein
MRLFPSLFNPAEQEKALRESRTIDVKSLASKGFTLALIIRA